MPNSRTRRYQIRITTMLFALTLIGLVFSDISHAWKMNRLADLIREQGGFVQDSSIQDPFQNPMFQLACWMSGEKSTLPKKVTVDDRCREPRRVMELIGRLTTLQELDLAKSEISNETLVSIANLKSLRYLSLQNQPVTDSSAAVFKHFTQLRVLSLQNTKIGNETASALANNPQLEILSLNSTQVTDKSVSQLIKLKNLKRLELARCNISDDGIEQLRQSLPRCNVMNRFYWE